MKTELIIRIAALFGVLAVIFGAFGAHALENMLVETGRLDTYETAVSYHFYHTLALLAVALLGRLYPENSRLFTSAWFFIAGILIFSGSLYTLCLSDVSWLGAITPIGGLAFILGWMILLVSFGKRNPS
ncbi:Uncharacterized membrane protein YgdD, TMEM256/DUF423 family [Cyclobacterium lianum]|uniref:Uncharacterized membrane protein YgdD, TMEM256/DUF423 family n=2 Tax=Cyclobacterium lianum TaxID=388280 RepID=A0A1M7QCN9_9BACT|nr:DUF423 domain-containing protein [Cyclobacterium lianum]SHN28372.1 Uncharacterized membrane protein YgdD, TMEM256/DUF423 family [Cyclobacterium lianum]